VMGACMGCSPAMALAVAHPDMVTSLVLYWPVGGPHYRINSHARFAEHLQHVRQQGLEGVVALARAGGKPFNQDPRGGPWATVLHRDEDFSHAYRRQDAESYERLVTTMRDGLFDRD